MMNQWIHRLASAVLAIAFALGFLTEGNHRCASTPASTTAEAHTAHNSSSDHSPDSGTCECLGRCCAVAPLAWGPETYLVYTAGISETREQLELSSQQVPRMLRGRLPPSQGPPSLR